MSDEGESGRSVRSQAYELAQLPSEPLRLVRVTTHVLAAPAPEPVRTSFGVMYERPAVLVELEDEDGVIGWGEAWCNFPIGGASHRANLIRRILAPMVEGEKFRHPSDLFFLLTDRVRVLAIQTGEEGPFAQSIAALDQAAWDLVARRMGKPLWRVLGGASDRVPVYASGINPTHPEETVERAREHGFSAFKLKIGFDERQDIRNLVALRKLIGMDAHLMVDANQAWSLDLARDRVRAMEEFYLDWLEEPLVADSPKASWQALASDCTIPLAAGENIRGFVSFRKVTETGVVRVLQPDLAKWGGFSGCLPVARAVLREGLRFCPHYLGGGVGLLASAQLLAAAGGDGLLEVDVNDNPLRTDIFGEALIARDGQFSLPSAPGIGMTPEPSALRAYAAS